MAAKKSSQSSLKKQTAVNKIKKEKIQAAKRQTIKKGVQAATPLDKRNRSAISKGIQATRSAAAQKKDMPDFAKKLGGNPLSNLVNEVKSVPGNIVKTGKSWAGTAARQAIPGAALVNVNKKGVSIKSKKEIVSNLKKDAGNLASMYGTAASSGRGASYAKNNTYTFGKRVVHGSPTNNLKKISPRSGSAAMPDKTVVWSWNPKDFPNRSRISSFVQPYAAREDAIGSVYVGKVKRSTIIPSQPGTTVSTGSMKVTKAIKPNDPKLGKKLEKALNKPAGLGKPLEARKQEIKTKLSKRKFKREIRKSDNIA